MPLPRVTVPVLVASLTALSGPAAAQSNTFVFDSIQSDAVRIAQAQNATIGLMGGGPGSTDARIAADIADVLNDGDNLRILPMLGKGAVQNIADLIHLKGVDMTIVNTDVLTKTMQSGSIPRESSMQYIAKLFQEEVHILARKDIAGLIDLNGKAVSVGPAGSGTELTAAALLQNAHISPTLLHDSQSLALDRLRRGEIAAMFIIGGKPVPALQAVETGTGLHFLPVPLNAQLVDTYLPTGLDHQYYPNLIPPGPPVDTVAVGSLLVTLAAPPDSLRAKRVNRFVEMLFERFDQFRQAGFHPKWQEVSLSAQVQGWTRYPAALTLLKKDQFGDASLRASFNTYLQQSGQTLSGMKIGRREAAFRKFLHMRDK